MKRTTLKKYTQKALKNLATTGNAIDATYASVQECAEIHRKENGLVKIGYASGVYGCNGLLFKGLTTGNLYVVTSRTSALFALDC